MEPREVLCAALAARDHYHGRTFLTPQSSVEINRLHTNCSSFDLPRWIESGPTPVKLVRSGDRTRTSCTYTIIWKKQRVNALRRSIRCGYCPPDLPPFKELCQAADQLLFSNILTNSGHLLHRFLPPPTAASQNYNLRIRPHNRQLTLHSGHLTDNNFFTRMLYAKIY